MIKKIVWITFATIITLGLTQGNSYAESDDDLKSIQDKREAIDEDLSEKEAKRDHLISEIKNLNKDVQQANAAIATKQERIDQTETDMTDTIQEIQTLQDEISELENAIEQRYDILKERLVSYQKAGGRVTYMDVIFGADDFSDATTSVSLVNRITNTDVDLMEQIEKDTEDAADKQDLALEKLDELNRTKEKQENALASIEEKRQKNEARIESLEAKQEELRDSQEDLQLKDSELASLEKETKRNIAQANTASAPNEKQKDEAETNKDKEKTNKQSDQQHLAMEKDHNHTEENDGQEPEEDPAQSRDSQLQADGESQAETDTDTENDTKDTEKNTDDDSENPAETEGNSFTVTATAYTVESAGGSGVTATGIDLTKNPDKKVIAVDPDVIPLGSIVKVEGYGYAVAGDTGGAIGGNKIDVFVPTQEEASAWGVREVKVTVQ